MLLTNSAEGLSVWEEYIEPAAILIALAACALVVA